MRTLLDEIGARRSSGVVGLVVLVSFCCRAAHASWVDPDTPPQHYRTKALAEGDAREFRLVGDNRSGVTVWHDEAGSFLCQITGRTHDGTKLEQERNSLFSVFCCSFLTGILGRV
jgi:hypothetical protein